VIDLLAFIESTDRALRENAKQFNPKDFNKLTPVEREQANAIQQENMASQHEAVAAIRQKADSYGLGADILPNWTDNLMRQGVIEKIPPHQFHHCSIIGVGRIEDEEVIVQAFDNLELRLEEMQEAAKSSITPPAGIFHHICMNIISAPRFDSLRLASVLHRPAVSFQQMRQLPLRRFH